MRPPTRRDDDEETDSMVSAHSLSDASFTTTHEALTRKHTSSQAPTADSTDPGTPAATLTPRPLTAQTDDSSPNTQSQYFTTLAGDVVPPVPAIPADFHSQGQTFPAPAPPTSTSSATATAPPNGVPVHKSRSVKSGVSRGRSGTRQHRGSEARKPSTRPVVDVDDLLGGLGIDDGDELESVGGQGLGKAPY